MTLVREEKVFTTTRVLRWYDTHSVVIHRTPLCRIFSKRKLVIFLSSVVLYKKPFLSVVESATLHTRFIHLRNPVNV